MKNIRPLNDFVVVKLVNKEIEIGGIIIPDSEDEKGVLATVVSVSPGIYNYHTGQLIFHQVKPGDTVVIPKIGGQKITIDGDDYFVYQAVSLLAVIE